MKKKQILNVFLSFLMVLTLFNFNAFAEEGSPGVPGKEASAVVATTVNITKYSIPKTNMDSQPEASKISSEIGKKLTAKEIAEKWSIGEDKIKPVKDVHFLVYQIDKLDSTKFNKIDKNNYLDKSKLKDLEKKVKELNSEATVTLIKDIKTNDSGLAKTDLGDGFYWIVEDPDLSTSKEAANVGEKKISVPIWLSLPIMSKGSRADEIYLYPKNVIEKGITSEKTLGNEYMVDSVVQNPQELTWYLQAKIPASYLLKLNYLRFEDSINETSLKGYEFTGTPVVKYVQAGGEMKDAKIIAYDQAISGKKAQIDLDSTKLEPIRSLANDKKDVTIYVEVKTVTSEKMGDLPLYLNNPLFGPNGYKLYYSPNVNVPKYPTPSEDPDDPTDPDAPSTPGDPISPSTPNTSLVPADPDRNNPPSGYDPEKPDSYVPTNDNVSPRIQLGGQKFKKTSEDGQTGLEGAKFYVFKNVDIDEVTDTEYLPEDIKGDSYYLAKDKSSEKTSWIQAINSDTAKTTAEEKGMELVTLTSGSDGTFEIKGLEPSKVQVTGLKNGSVESFGTVKNTYYIEEYEAPTGYEVSADPVEFTITAGVVNEVDETSTIQNFKPVMPLTGGKGKVVFIGAGIALLAIAGYVYRKKRSEV